MTIVVSAILFLFGSGLLVYINSNIDVINSDVFASSDDDHPIGKIIQPLVQIKEPFNILLLGGDKVNNLSDTMMLANFDPITGKINIMSIPRDTKVTIEGKTHKINYAYPHGGMDLAVKTVSELLNTKIKYSVYLDISAFRKIIDILDGVTLYIPPGMDYDDPLQDLHIHLKEGTRKLNGKEAEQFMRFRQPNKWTKELRKYYDGSDLKRIEAQQRLIKALIEQKLNVQYLARINSIVEVIFDNVETNFTMSELLKLSKYLSKLDTKNITFHSLPGNPQGQSPWYFVCDKAEAAGIVTQYFKCEDDYIQ